MMGDAAGELPHRFHLLRLPEFLLDLLMGGQIADEAGEQMLTAHLHLADGKLHRKHATILALAADHPPDADDALFARAQVPLQVAVVLLAVGEGISMLMFRPTTSSAS